MRRILFITIGIIFSLLLIEVVLRLFPVPSGMNLKYGFGTERLLSYTPNTKIVYSRDWDFLYAREGMINREGYHGFCAPITQANQPRMWVIGDSYVEALMVDESESLSAHIQRILPSISVCSKGISGAPGTEYLAILDHTLKVPAQTIWVVVLNTADIPDSFSAREGFHRYSSELTDALTGTKRTEPAWLALAKESALFRFLNYNLNIKSIAKQFSCNINPRTCPNSQAQFGVDNEIIEFRKKTSRLISDLKTRSLKRGEQIIVVINAFNPPDFKSDQLRQIDNTQRVIMREELKVADLVFVDVGEAFAESKDCYKSPCYLFRDGHWSPVGHKVVAEKIVSALSLSPIETLNRLVVTGGANK